jgi:intracellular multiplication protein IcmV
MKKKSGSRIGRVFSRIFNIRTWFDWDRIKSFTLALRNGIKSLFIPQKSDRVESFDSAITKLKLTDAELLLKQNALYRLSIVMTLAAFLILVYTGYQLFYGSYKAVLVSFVVMMIALVLAFRYHFWYFQIKRRKLGCTFEEWFRQGLMGEKE